MRAWGSRYAHLVLERCGANKRKACRVLGITYHTLQAYLKYEAQADGAADATDTMSVSDGAMVVERVDPLEDVSDEGLDTFETAAPE